VRATYGGLFIGSGIAVMLIASSEAALVLGAAWGGAFAARAILSMTPENCAFVTVEK